jgi:hypothetical protein
MLLRLQVSWCWQDRAAAPPRRPAAGPRSHELSSISAFMACRACLSGIFPACWMLLSPRRSAPTPRVPALLPSVRPGWRGRGVRPGTVGSGCRGRQVEAPGRRGRAPEEFGSCQEAQLRAGGRAGSRAAGRSDESGVIGPGRLRSGWGGHGRKAKCSKRWVGPGRAGPGWGQGGRGCLRVFRGGWNRGPVRPLCSPRRPFETRSPQDPVHERHAALLAVALVRGLQPLRPSSSRVAHVQARQALAGAPPGAHLHLGGPRRERAAWPARGRGWGRAGRALAARPANVPRRAGRPYRRPVSASCLRWPRLF